ncbi:MAG: MBL fold metallo-hydrolase [Spirochaetales bacterium]|nr:MBL fold metallo-hydrolase [Spirochaetales bacterium]
MEIKLWGVRGSIPSPGADTIKYGGNTTCLSIDLGPDKKEIIIDGGSGIRLLGNHLVKKYLPAGNIDINMLITHTHWDHIMGFPFFTPVYIPTTKMKIYGPVTYEEGGIDEIIGSQFQYRYFPVIKNELSAKIEYFPLKETVFYLDDEVKITTKYLNHPVLCLGYKIEYRDKVFCLATDSEPYRNVFSLSPDDPDYDELAAEEGEAAAQEENRKLVDFYRGADLLIHDAQYTEAEYKNGKLGWGHSSYEYIIETASAAGVKELVLTHHDPERTDEELDRFAAVYYEKYSEINKKMHFSLAVEGTVFKL